MTSRGVDQGTPLPQRLEQYLLNWRLITDIDPATLRPTRRRTRRYRGPLDQALALLAAKHRFLQIVHDFILFDAGLIRPAGRTSTPASWPHRSACWQFSSNMRWAGPRAQESSPHLEASQSPVEWRRSAPSLSAAACWLNRAMATTRLCILSTRTSSHPAQRS
jgi:hypothetical protein